ncbi:hypothetical protein [Paenibacillus sp. FJAT-27812]|uniref:hypothetical protein n=1 Tax=Paenibacillus sp. FJAT-27812 TaxID=1684143 RepID=UPI0006A75C7B|nr:hypothetical protein [Paenibacillus sp. FJAT-27812]
MKVADARAAAALWVMEHASLHPDFMGAYFSGSTITMPDDMEMPAASDVDIVIVTSHREPPVKLGKFEFHGALIEVTYMTWSQLSSAREVLTSYHLAGSFRMNTIIADPTKQLGRLQSEVSRHFSELEWVRRRCENARQKIENGLLAINNSAPLHDQVTSWLFPTGVTTHMILVAALRNPTVRLRYVAAREVLLEYGFSNLYEELLELLGCSHLTPELVEYHLGELARTFDAAAAVAKTPFFFSSDITAEARKVAIDGSHELIRAGLHREAIFWIVATFARCHTILAADASPELQESLTPAFKAVIADIGIHAPHALINRSKKVLEFLPALSKATEAIMMANPAISSK